MSSINLLTSLSALSLGAPPVTAATPVTHTIKAPPAELPTPGAGIPKVELPRIEFPAEAVKIFRGKLSEPEAKRLFGEETLKPGQKMALEGKQVEDFMDVFRGLNKTKQDEILKELRTSPELKDLPEMIPLIKAMEIARTPNTTLKFEPPKLEAPKTVPTEEKKPVEVAPEKSPGEKKPTVSNDDLGEAVVPGKGPAEFKTELEKIFKEFPEPLEAIELARAEAGTDAAKLTALKEYLPDYLKTLKPEQITQLKAKLQDASTKSKDMKALQESLANKLDLAKALVEAKLADAKLVTTVRQNAQQEALTLMKEGKLKTVDEYKAAQSILERDQFSQAIRDRFEVMAETLKTGNLTTQDAKELIRLGNDLAKELGLGKPWEKAMGDKGFNPDGTLKPPGGIPKARADYLPPKEAEQRLIDLGFEEIPGQTSKGEKLYYDKKNNVAWTIDKPVTASSDSSSHGSKSGDSKGAGTYKAYPMKGGKANLQAERFGTYDANFRWIRE